MTAPLEAAMGYLRRGWSVVPGVSVNDDGICPCSSGAQCDSPGKHPRVKWKPYQTTLPTEAEVRDWWRRWPDANVIIITGSVSGIVAVDADTRHGGDESLHDLALPSTLTSLTGGGGQHLIYQHPGQEMRNGAGLMPGIDFRGDGGYIVAPPSRHSSGRRYTWDVGEPDEPAPLPAKVVELHAKARGGIGRDPADRTFDEESILNDPIPEGRRNETLVRIAGHYAADGRPYSDLLRTVLGCNGDLCQPPLSRDEVVKLVESVYQAEQRKRQLRDAVEETLNGNNGHNGFHDDDRRIMAAQAWRDLTDPPLTTVLDWMLIRGELPEYVLITEDDEARLGNDLLNQLAVRRALHRELGVYLKPVEAKQQWPRTANLLRRLAREEQAAETMARARIDTWLDAIEAEQGRPVDPPMRERRGYLATRPIVVANRIHLKPSALRRWLEAEGERITAEEVRTMLKRAGFDSKAHVGIENEEGMASTMWTWAAPLLTREEVFSE